MTVLIVFLSFFGICEAQSVKPAKPLTRLMQLALENSPTIKTAERTMESTTLQRKNATAQLLPSLDFETRAGLADSNPRFAQSEEGGSQPPWTSGLNLKLSQKLYDNGESLTQRQIALRAEKRARFEFELTRDEQLAKLAQVYYVWSEQVQMRTIEESRRQILQTQYRMMHGQFRQGMKTKRDVLRIETELRRSELDRLKLENDIRLAEVDVAAIAGISVDRLEREGVKPQEPNSNWNPPDTFKPLKVEEHKRWQVLDLQQDEADLQVDLKRRLYWPQINLSGEIGYGTQDYLGTEIPPWENDGVQWQAMVTLTYNLFDFGQRRRNIEIQKIEAAAVGDANRRALIELTTELRTTLLRLQEGRETIRLAKELLGLEQSSFTALERDFRDGRTSYLDLITNLNTLIEAKGKFISSYFNFKTQQVNYAYHEGRVQEFIKAE